MSHDHHAHHHDDDRPHERSGHHHDHGHHHHASTDHGRAFLIGVCLNLGFVAAEYVAGYVADSVALLADATHNLGDVLGLLLSWGALILGRRLPSQRFTYGLRSSSILAALANAAILLLVTGGLAWEALQRTLSPPAVNGDLVMVVAAAGVVVNGITAWLFHGDAHDDLNVRSAYLHMLADAAVSVGVVVAGLGIRFLGWNWLDPVTSLVLVLVIALSSWGLLRDSLSLALHAVPPAIDPGQVRQWLGARAGVSEVHDLHIWAMSTTENALTVHLVTRDGHPGDGFLQSLASDVEQRFGIHHLTVQIELGDAEAPCPLAPDHIV